MERGFFKSLFDFSFSSFITVRLIKVIYALFIAGSALFALAFVASAFRASALFGLFMLLIVAPVLFFFYVIIARVYLELVVAIFRIAENTSILAGRGTNLSAPPPPAPAGPPPPVSDEAIDDEAIDDEPPPPPPPSLADVELPPSPPTAEVELPAEDATPRDAPRPRLRPRRQAPLRPRRPASVPPPEPPT
jgi:signal transduction histidine kinase